MAAPMRRSARFQVAATNPTPRAITTVSTTSAVPKSNGRKRAKVEIETMGQTDEIDLTLSSRVKPQGSKVPKVKAISAMDPDDFPQRVQSDWKVGAHVSAAGGVENAIINAASISANAFALFVKSQRKWSSPHLTPNSIEAFRSRLRAFNYDPDFVLPHGSYLINLGNPDEERREKSYECFLDDLRRCEQLGLTRYNFHPGSTVGAGTKEESIIHIAASLNRAHKETSTVVTVIENMAGSGNVLGSKFEEIAQIIDRVEDKSRVGVCIDTCHTFAAGYDIRSKNSYEAMISEFERVIGLRYLRGMHLNDSKTSLGSHKDRHDNIGRGHIALASFGYIMSDTRLRHIPLILETPTNEDSSVWKKEIEVLNELSLRPNMDETRLQQLADEIEVVVGRITTGKVKAMVQQTKDASALEKTKGAKKGRKRNGRDIQDEGLESCDEV